MRRLLKRQAARAGLGRVRRVHRERLGWGLPITAAVVLSAGSLVLLHVERVFDRYHWSALAVPVLPVVALGLAAAWVHLAALPGFRQRRHVAVCDGGLLVWSAELSDRAVIPWEAIERHELHPGTEPSDPSDRVYWTRDGKKRTLRLGGFSWRRDLILALMVRRPVPRWGSLGRRAVAALVVAGVLAFATWHVARPFLVPITVSAADTPGPEDPAGYAPACERAGARFEGAAPYHGDPGDQTAVVFQVGEDGRVDDPSSAVSLWRGDVELVACSHQTGRGPEGLVRSCPYTHDIVIEHYQGQYRVDVYEARTGRKLGSVTVNGVTEASCGFFTVADYEGEVMERETAPDSSDYARAIEELLKRQR